MIITASLFFNELDLLRLKCETLKGVVDAHVIVEATTTFTGKPKPLYFAENREQFKGFNIISSVVDLPKDVPSPWDREGASHRLLLQAVKPLSPEIVIWSDTDEIARPDSVERFRKVGREVATLEMDHLIFFFDRHRADIKDRNGKIAFFDKNREHQPWRGETHWPVLNDAGWHFEYFGQRDTLLEKLNATSHAVEEGAAHMRDKVALGELPGIEISSSYPLEKLPAYVQANRERYSQSFSSFIEHEKYAAKFAANCWKVPSL